MNPRRLTLVIAAAGLGGCAAVPLPPEAAAVALVPVPSPSVAVYRPKFNVTDDRPMLEGCVYRQFEALTTANSHVDIVFLSAGGRELRSELVCFAPRDLRRGSGHIITPSGHYRLSIPVLPSGTARIEVRAHDEPHSS